MTEAAVARLRVGIRDVAALVELAFTVPPHVGVRAVPHLLGNLERLQRFATEIQASIKYQNEERHHDL